MSSSPRSSQRTSELRLPALESARAVAPRRILTFAGRAATAILRQHGSHLTAGITRLDASPGSVLATIPASCPRHMTPCGCGTPWARGKSLRQARSTRAVPAVSSPCAEPTTIRRGRHETTAATSRPGTLRDGGRVTLQVAFEARFLDLSSSPLPPMRASPGPAPRGAMRGSCYAHPSRSASGHSVRQGHQPRDLLFGPAPVDLERSIAASRASPKGDEPTRAPFLRANTRKLPPLTSLVSTSNTSWSSVTMAAQARIQTVPSRDPSRCSRRSISGPCAVRQFGEVDGHSDRARMNVLVHVFVDVLVEHPI